METLSSGLMRFRSIKKATTISIIYGFLLFILVLIFQNGSAAVQILNFNFLPLSMMVMSFFATFFDLFSAFTTSTLLLSIASSVIGGLTIGVFYAYFKIRKNAVKTGALAVHGMLYFISILAIQCIACGAVLFVTFFSLIGGIWILEMLPLKGVEFGIIALLIQSALLYLLITKLAKEPLLC